MSLRLRLSIIVCLLLVSGMVFGVLFQLSQASDRVEREVNATASLAYQLLSAVIPSTPAQASHSMVEELAWQLRLSDSARHLDIWIDRPDESSAVITQAGNETRRAPDWFRELVQPEPLHYSLALPGDSSIRITTNPADEISEVWNEALRFLLVLSLVLIVVTAILLYFLGRWLRPVQQIVSSIEQVELGNYSEPAPVGTLPELKLIAKKLSHLNKVLRQSKEENDRLNELALKVQEEERKKLARELHDEMGQSISAIKAIAFSIAERTASIDNECQEGAMQIGEITNTMRDQVKRMMSQLRTAELDDLGLLPALQQMVDDWNRHHQHTFCTLQYDEAFAILNPDQQIHLFRIIQEALTNVARHAEASLVRVTMDNSQYYQLVIEDNGKGFTVGKSASGMGMRSIRERVHSLGGTIKVGSEPGKGTRLNIHIPAAGTDV